MNHNDERAEKRRLRLLTFRDRHNTSRWLGNIVSDSYITDFVPTILFHIAQVKTPSARLHRIRRLEYCNAGANWDEEWNRIVFSPFCLWAMMVGKEPGVKKKKKWKALLRICWIPETEFTRGVMIRSEISLGNRISNANWMFKDTFKKFYSCLLFGTFKVIFQQDYVRPHTKAVTGTVLSGRQYPYSHFARLRPIEHICDMMEEYF